MEFDGHRKWPPPGAQQFLIDEVQSWMLPYGTSLAVLSEGASASGSNDLRYLWISVRLCVLPISGCAFFFLQICPVLSSFTRSSANFSIAASIFIEASAALAAIAAAQRSPSLGGCDEEDAIGAGGPTEQIGGKWLWYLLEKCSYPMIQDSNQNQQGPKSESN